MAKHDEIIVCRPRHNHLDDTAISDHLIKTYIINALQIFAIIVSYLFAISLTFDRFEHKKSDYKLMNVKQIQPIKSIYCLYFLC
jgi:hypothetical protein